MKEIKLIDTNTLEDIKHKLRILLTNQSLFPSNADSIYLLLYLLILKKDGVLKGVHKESPAIAIDLIKDRIVNSDKDGSELKANIHFHLDWYLNNVNNLEFFSIIELFNNFNKEVFEAHFIEIFEDLLFHAAKLQGPYTGEFIQPAELSRLLCNLVGKKENLTIYNPFAGVASFNINFPESCKYYGQEIIGKIWSIGALRICAYDHDNNSKYTQEDSITNWLKTDHKFDLVISNPPFNMKVNPQNGNSSFVSIENFIIKNGLDSIKNDGKIILTVPNGFLFSDKELPLKRRLVEDDLLEAIITFPGGLLMNTSIPFSVIIINKAKQNKGIIKFIDGKGFVGSTNRKFSKILDYQLFSTYSQNLESEFIKSISLTEVAEHDFNLSVNRYFSEKVIGTKISKILTSIKPSSTFDEKVGIEIKISDLNSDAIDYKLKAKNLNVVELRKGYYKVSTSCLLISSKGNHLKPTYFNFEEVPIFVSNDIFAFTINEKLVTVEYLINQLKNAYFISQLESIKNGSTIQFINREDFLNLSIQTPSIEDQETIVKRYIREYNLIKLRELGLEKELEEAKLQQKHDLSIKKHNIMQHLNNLKSAADLIQRKRTDNNGVLDFNQIIDKSNNLSLSDIYNGLVGSIDNVLYYVDNLTNEINFHPPEDIDLNLLVRNAISKAKQNQDLYTIDYSIDKNSLLLIELEDPDTGQPFEIAPFVNFSSIDFYELFNNILENAINHGFTDKTKKYTFRIRLEADLGANKLKLSFSNNGNPFPKGMAERYSIKGEKAGLNANKGIGSWKIYEIAKHFGCELKINDHIEEEFTVNIELIIPLA